MPIEETVPTSKLAETSRSLVKVPKAKKVKPFFRISKKDAAAKITPPLTKDNVPNPIPSIIWILLVGLNESGGVSGIKRNR